MPDSLLPNRRCGEVERQQQQALTSLRRPATLNGLELSIRYFAIGPRRPARREDRERPSRLDDRQRRGLDSSSHCNSTFRIQHIAQASWKPFLLWPNPRTLDFPILQPLTGFAAIHSLRLSHHRATGKEESLALVVMGSLLGLPFLVSAR